VRQIAEDPQAKAAEQAPLYKSESSASAISAIIESISASLSSSSHQAADRPHQATIHCSRRRRSCVQAGRCLCRRRAEGLTAPAGRRNLPSPKVFISSS